MDWVYIGETPCDEDCLPSTDHRSKQETAIFARQLRRQFPTADIRVKRELGGNGGYYCVCAYYDESDDDAVDLAFRIESECPQYWDLPAKFELSRLLSVDEFNDRFSKYESID